MEMAVLKVISIAISMEEILENIMETIMVITLGI
jgi:hypothetical protein